MERQGRSGAGCFASLIGMSVVVAVVVAVIFAGVIVLAIVAAVVVLSLVALAIDRLLLAISPKRRARREAMRRSIMGWEFGQSAGAQSGPIIDSTAHDVDPGSEHRPEDPAE